MVRLISLPFKRTGPQVVTEFFVKLYRIADDYHSDVFLATNIPYDK
ncbi:hypothetical protein Phep_0094 [Pedobacter heparinus DSM 2366]|uniref:Uncharacterized protein n=1 Tax=Pedobacter heparinus (strain ATCC 13125 / DSM 2366 / CIP 104194 / JCM 7457 / NBRC 12017 / NCIMB 9290 / NRRL B-14731 / HIM 762-3) TaxID=485917 RepID=C6XY53_PEDHD|nr:hypothetical protein Phep_0094 [Pedobacter heparinus DSM 2366]